MVCRVSGGGSMQGSSGQDQGEIIHHSPQQNAAASRTQPGQDWGCRRPARRQHPQLDGDTLPERLIVLPQLEDERRSGKLGQVRASLVDHDLGMLPAQLGKLFGSPRACRPWCLGPMPSLPIQTAVWSPVWLARSFSFSTGCVDTGRTQALRGRGRPAPEGPCRRACSDRWRVRCASSDRRAFSRSAARCDAISRSASSAARPAIPEPRYRVRTAH